MYRAPGTIDEKETPPAELRVPCGERTRPGSMMLQVVVVPLVVAALAASVIGPTVGLVALVLSAGGLYWYFKRSPPELALSVEDRDLVVSRGKRRLYRMRLSALRNVSLDTKSITPVQEGNSAIPAMRFIDSRVGPEIDVARIVLVGDGPELALTKDHLPHMEASESLGKIRVFLRKHGWLPEDEAPASGVDEDDEG